MNWRVGSLVIDSNTAPGYIMACVCVFTALLCLTMSKKTVAKKPSTGSPAPAPSHAHASGSVNASAPDALAPPHASPASGCFSAWLGSWREWLAVPSNRSFAIAFCVFLALNFVQKGVLTLMEAVLAPDFRTAFVDSDNDLGEDTDTYITALGAGGLAMYAFMISLPTKADKTQSNAATTSGPSILPPASAHTNASSSTCARWAASAQSLRAFIQRHIQVIESGLLIASLTICGLGAFICAPTVGTSSLTRLTVGFALIWSIGSPVADILAASMFAVVVAGNGGRQGPAMGWISAAGSMGRILFPLMFGFMGHPAMMCFSGIACLACSAAAAWLLFSPAPTTPASTYVEIKDAVEVTIPMMPVQPQPVNHDELNATAAPTGMRS